MAPTMTSGADRLHQVLLIVSTLVASWLGMQAVHELGHVLGAWLTGGHVERVVLNPLTISRTDLAENPHPLLVAGAGPTVGAALPLLLWVAVSCTAKQGWRQLLWLLRFFAGFCLIANGLYIGLGSFARIGDCGDMLEHGSQPWQLWLFGLVTAPLGLFLWDRLGPRLGLAKANVREQTAGRHASPDLWPFPVHLLKQPRVLDTSVWHYSSFDLRSEPISRMLNRIA